MSGHLHLVAGESDRGRTKRPRSPIRIVLADDHVAMRRNLRQLLEHENGMTVVAEATDASAAERQVRAHRPHVLVLDLGTPGGSSLETIGRLCRVFPDTEVVVLTMDPNATLARRALQAGAVGFVLKDTADDELAVAVRMAAAGEEYVSPRVALGRDGHRGVAGANDLTSRETEVLQLIALGHTSAEIAGTLHLSRRTIEAHRAHIHHKLRTKTRAELVRCALERRLIGA